MTMQTLMSPDAQLIIVPVVSGILGIAGGVLGVKLVQKRAAKRNIKMAAKEIREAAKKPKLMMDVTKRKSLQPGNHAQVPKGWDAVKSQVAPKPKEKRIVKPTPPIDKPFTHKFFGTQLVVGGQRVIFGLTKKLHTLEIIKDQCFMDNKVYEINRGDLERLKTLIRDSRG